MTCDSMRLDHRLHFALLAFLLIVSSATGPSANAAEDPIEFNRDIRPILSDKCFFCHGPDKHERQAELRLDQEEAAIRRVDGDYIIRRGRPNESMLYQRITDTDVDVRMPPTDSGKTLSDAEIALIKRWIEAGGKWQKHWAFIPPKRPALPKVSNESWPRNAIDYFILARLDREGLKPSRRATKETLIRRLSFDLTGLPPTIEEIDRFLADKSPQAYERVVQHYLKSERYGEHMARFWLDAARYGDSHGYEYDQSRLMWPWREWVIRAYNKNQPFDAFTADQLAGDLMTNPDDFQLTASGFNRNHPISVEGGIIDEEYRTEYAVDRVVTTTSVWLGLTFTCARCHDHKFDPISQQDFYQLFAFFNQIPESGKGDDDGFAPVRPVMTEGLRKRANALQQRTTEMKAQFRKDTPALRSAQKRWASKLREPVTWNYVGSKLWTADNGTILTSVGTSSVLASQPANGPETYTATIDTGLKEITALRLEAVPHESLPAGGLGLAENGWFALSKIRVAVIPPGVTRLAGRYVRVEIFGEKKLVTLAEVQAFDDAGENVALGSKATQSSTGWGGHPERANDGNTSPNYGDGSQSHTEIQKDPWFEIDLGSTKSLSSLVIWNRNEDGLHTELNGAVVSILDEDRKVVWEESVAEASKEPQEFSLSGERRLEFAYAHADSAHADFPATNLIDSTNSPTNGWIPTEIGDGQSVTLALAKPLEVPKGSTITIRLVQKHTDPSQQLGHFRVGLCSDPTAIAVAKISPQLLDIAKRIERTREEETQLMSYYRTVAPELDKLRHQISDLEKQTKTLEASYPVVMVMKELADKRMTYVLERGEYDQPRKAQEIHAEVPKVLHPFPKNAPRNRLGLTQWLTAPDNPLTARVTVNRYWQKYFGTGIVKTTENFGSQADWPSHPKLLDWLATEFVANNWDIRQMQRLIVLSSTYQQLSNITASALEKDPGNRLLARGPQLRLEAETIRDNALAVSGLLVERIGGPSVFPYQPTGLWRDLSNRVGYSEYYSVGEGSDLYRRSIYTFWKRSVPPATMAIFDAPSRESCVLTRSRTNTPLQSLVLMHDPQYVEAARKLAERIMLEGGKSVDEQITFAFRLATSRRPNATELAELNKYLLKQRRRYAADEKAAMKILSIGDSPRNESLDPFGLAAWTELSRLIFNLSETISKG